MRQAALGTALDVTQQCLGLGHPPTRSLSGLALSGLTQDQWDVLLLPSHCMQLRTKAHARGIPFISINAPITEELRLALLPVSNPPSSG